VLHFRRPRSLPFARTRTPNGSAQSRSINPPRAGKSLSNIMHHRLRGRAHSVACARIKATCKARVYFWGLRSPRGIFANRTRLFSSPGIACRIARTRADIYIGFSALVPWPFRVKTEMRHVNASCSIRQWSLLRCAGVPLTDKRQVFRTDRFRTRREESTCDYRFLTGAEYKCASAPNRNELSLRGVIDCDESGDGDDGEISFFRRIRNR